MNGDDLTKDELLSRFFQLEQRVEELEQARKVENIEQLQEQLDQKNERINEFEACLHKYENPHTPSSKRRSATDESPTAQDDDEDDDVRTDGGTAGRNKGHDPEWRTVSNPDEVIEVTCECCPECGEHFDELAGVSPRLVEGIPDPQPSETTQYNHHHYECDSCGRRSY